MFKPFSRFYITSKTQSKLEEKNLKRSQDIHEKYLKQDGSESENDFQDITTFAHFAQKPSTSKDYPNQNSNQDLPPKKLIKSKRSKKEKDISCTKDDHEIPDTIASSSKDNEDKDKFNITFLIS